MRIVVLASTSDKNLAAGGPLTRKEAVILRRPAPMKRESVLPFYCAAERHARFRMEACCGAHNLAGNRYRRGRLSG